MTPQSSDSRGSEIDFAPLGHMSAQQAGGRSIDIVRFALSIWKPMVAGLGLGLLLGIAAYLYLGPAYDASTRILVSEKSSMPADSRGLNTTGDRGEHVTLIRSDAIVHRALQDHGLGKLPAFDGGLDPIQDVIDGLKVSRTAGRDNSKDNVFDIGYTHPDPQTAAKVVESVIAAYRDFLDERHNTNVADLSVRLKTQQKELTAEITRLEKAHIAWRDEMPPIFRSTPVVTASGGTAIMPNRYEQDLDQISKLLQDNFLDQQDTKAKLSTLKEMLASNQSRDVIEFWVMHSMSSGSSTSEGGKGGGGGGANVFAGPPAKAALDSQLLTARMTEARLLNLLGPDHSDVQKARKQVQTILDFYQQQGIAPPRLDPLSPNANGKSQGTNRTDMASAYRLTLENHLRFLANQEVALKTQYEQAEGRAKKAATMELEDQRRKDQIATKKKEYDDVTRQIVEFTQSKDQEGYTVQPIAQVRVTKSMKRALKIIGAFAVLGICAVFALAYLREWYDTSIRDEEEVRRNIGAQVLGAVPGFQATQAANRALVESTGISSAVCYYHRPGSHEAEAYRTVRTAIFSATRETGEKVIQFSSPEPGDGKTTSAVNLAVAMAQSGKRVLLVDADLRRPTVHVLLGLANRLGLAEVLHGDIQWETAVQPTRIDGLSVIPSGACPDNPAELLSAPTLGQLLRQARTDYDYVLVDSPPLLAVTDPCIIAPHTDGMLLVIRILKNKRAALQRAREAIDTHGIRLYGVVANDLSRDRNSDGSAAYSEYYRHHTTAAEFTSLPAGTPREAAGV